ncbi:MAG TPA: hypothetical protein VIM75_17010 [Ohtaekwangia sp.]|uniref:hypothetical protein n=1 Tax=Ohtaekwangia sp. TaxID=2066019 RepID=UPI002F9456FF
MSRIKISETKYYTLFASTEKNRAYLKIIGFWRSPEQVPNYLADWKATLSKLKSGFTLLTDASEMKTHPKDVVKLHEQAQAMVLKHGVKKVAEVLRDDIAEMQLNAVAKATLFPKQNFRSVEDAEKWLDE